MLNKKDCSTSRVINNGDGTYTAYTKEGAVIGTWAQTGPAGPQGATGAQGPPGTPGPAGADGATGAPGPTAVSADSNNLASIGTDGLLFVDTPAKKAYHPAIPIADVAENLNKQQLASNANTFEVEDTNDFIIEFGVDGKMRITKRTYAARLSLDGYLQVMAGAEPVVPFDTIAFNLGGQAALTPAHFTAPFACLLHVDALAVWDHEEWTNSDRGPWVGVSVNGAPALKLGFDYAVKGLAFIGGGSTNEVKAPGGGALLTLAAGDQVNVVVGHNEDLAGGYNHSINAALASFYIISAL